MPEDLSKYDPTLRGIYYIEGIGLCSNMYALEASNGLALVDTGVGDRINRIEPKQSELNLRIEDVTRIILTHTHFDHTGGIPEVTGRTDPTVLVHQEDAPGLKIDNLRVSYLNEGDSIEGGGRKFKVLHTPGHTAGSICLYDGAVIFSGDTVFPGGSFGRVDLPTSDPKQMLSSLARLAELTPKTLLSGHGEPAIGDAPDHLKLSYSLAKSYFT
jgi:glyoxylase-like metal-dependent hydrolase (beta-lactamase superfamily II)